MKIKINNCSSPGASFTANTEKVMLACYDWIQENKDEHKDFIDFRKEVSKAKNFNDNNARNIYPLLLKAGFIDYMPKTKLEYKKFFTKLGAAYIKSIQLIQSINNSEDYDKKQKLLAIKEATNIKEEIVYSGLINLIKTDSNYKKELKEMIRFLINYEKINKFEFAYMLYTLQNEKRMDVNKINLYRNNDITIEVEIEVRNDIDIRNEMGITRIEGIDYLTSYSYFTSILEQCGLIIKNKDYFEININNKGKLTKLLEVE